MKARRLPYALQLAVLFAAYLVTAKSGLNAYPGGHQVTVIWPPSGIALAGLLIFGYRVWPAILAAELVMNLTLGDSALLSIALAVGNTIEPLLGAFLLRKIGRIHNSLDRVVDVLYFITLAAVFSTLVGATIGTSSLLIFGAIHRSVFTSVWSQWWVGDLLGDLLVAPFLLVWSFYGFRSFRNARSALKGSALLFLLITASTVAFWGVSSKSIKPFILAYVVFPLLVWISLRFRQIGSVTAIFIASWVAILGTLVTLKHTDSQTLTNQLIVLQTFIGSTAATFLIISAGVMERDTNYLRRLELMTRANQLSKQKAHLQALNLAKDDFITIASHQLKTPPTIIKQYVGMLLDNRGGIVSDKQRFMLQHVYDSNERQLRIIRDILNIAQIDTGHVVIQKEDVDLVTLVSDVIDNKSDLCHRRQQSLSFSHARRRYQAYADRTKLYMIIDNIVDNASKFSPEGKSIEIKITRYNALVSISVKDHGIGFSREDTRKLFQKFTRIGTAITAPIEGTGIGLYWAKKIIDLHGGTITAISRLDHGSTFRVTLPVATVKAARVKTKILKQTKTPAMEAGVNT